MRGGSREAAVVVVAGQRGCTLPSQLLDCAVVVVVDDEEVVDHCCWA